MKVWNRLLPLILTSTMLLMSSCEDVPSAGRRITSSGVNNGNSNNTGGNNAGGNPVVPVDGGLGGTTEEIDPKVEIRHLVEPKINDNDDGGAYTRKITLPKNYNGLLYLAGINVNTLRDKNVKVRFRFGQTREPITISATVSQAAGLTPQTAVEVLVMDLRYKPFNNLKLIYDLYDYNEYTFHNINTDTALSEPVQNNRDKNLFCRGLKLTDDPTFTSPVQDGCVGSNHICKYAYAKVVDKGLVKVPASGAVQPITPTQPQIQVSNDGLYRDTDQIMLERCLPNNPSTASYVYKDESLYSSILGPLTQIFNGYNDSKVIAGETYRFRGPYRTINSANWAIGSQSLTDSAVFGPYGLFKGALLSTTMDSKLESATQSLLFPIATKFNLLKDTEYVGSNSVTGDKSYTKMSANGESGWMDGCNLRATTVESNTGENIGSCNVTASIEILTVDEDGTETIVADSKEVKLQLVKPQEINANNEDVTHSSFQSCSSSNQCGSNECCFNKRCWDNSLVSQCVDDANRVGNLSPGASCLSDFECSSLCCNQATGKCAVHDTLQDPQVYCSKPSGQFCIAREWCAKHTVTECAIVKTGVDALGQTTCALRCYTHQEFGDCVNGICRPPTPPEMPVFNPLDPNKCATAIDPPVWNENTGINGAGVPASN